MTDGPPHAFPPPGAPPPEDPEGTRPQPGAGGPPPPYGGPAAPYPAYPTYPPHAAPAYGGMLGAAHKPGAIPLRPLTLGSIYDGAFRIIRFNPAATVGAAVLVTALANLLPVIVTAVLQVLTGVSFEAGMETGAESSAELSTADALAVLGIVLSLLGGAIATWFGMVFVTGMIAHVAHAAAVGRRLTLAEAWTATRGKRWRLVGLNLVIGLGWLLVTGLYAGLWVAVVMVTGEALVILAFAVVSVPAYLCAMFWYWIRIYYLPVPALMLEPGTGVFAAIGRGHRLTARQFWRTFGIALLTYLIATIAGSILTTPVSIIGQLLAVAVPDAGWLILVVTNAVAYVIQYAFVAPFTAVVVALQYLDQRIRKEAYDVELMTEAGVVHR